jgi:hypothetical protein
MAIENILAVLGWSMVVNFGILLFWALVMKLMPNLTYRTQSIITPISREDFDKSWRESPPEFRRSLA